MPYTKTNWQTAKITADNFNKLQTQYAEAVADAIGIRANGTAELRAEVVSDFPAHSVGRIIYHNGKKMFFYSNGIEWLLDPKETFWGDAQNGVFSSTGNVTFTNTLGATVIRNYRNFTLNPGHTMTTQNGCRCLVIRSWGDITINGIVDLDRKGGFGDRYITINGVQYDLLGGLGGNGGASGAVAGGTVDSGSRSAGGMRGGGGAGGSGLTGAGGAGGAKNTPSEIGGASPFPGVRSFSDPDGGSNGTAGTNGAGGSGGAYAAEAYQAIGGFGGTSIGGGSGGGGGGARASFNSAFAFDGKPYPSGNGQYGGGVLILLAMGDIIINGQIQCRGGFGGAGGAPDGDINPSGGGGGGGSGGGKIIVIRRGNYTLNGTTLLTGGNGGAGHTGGQNGTAGEDGTISEYQL